MAALVDDARPVLRAVVLDMSACAHIDVTSVQGLVDIRNQLDRHAAPVEVEWHFAHVHSRWTRRALAVAGFGYPATGHVGRWRPVFSIAAAADAASVFGGHGSAEEELEGGGGTTSDEEKGIPRGGAGKAGSRSAGKTVEAVEEATAAEASQAPPAVPQAVGSEGRLVPVTGVDRPFFHLDVAAAVESVLEKVRSGGR
jgi:sodium-independent sulfate anion transporter 11